MEKISIISTDPQELVELMKESFRDEFQKFKEELNRKRDEQDLLTIDEVCQLLKIDQSTLWHLRKQGKVQVYAIGSRRYFKKEEIFESLIKLK